MGDPPRSADQEPAYDQSAEVAASVDPMSDIEHREAARHADRPMTRDEISAMWGRVYRAESERYKAERDDARQQLRGAVDALRDLIGNAPCRCDDDRVKSPCSKCRARSVLASLASQGQ